MPTPLRCCFILVCLCAGLHAGEAPRLLVGRSAAVAAPAKAIVLVSPGGSAASEVFEDCLTTALLKRGTKVVSSMARNQRLADLDRGAGKEAAKAGEKKEATKERGPRDELLLTAWARDVGADAVVVGSLVLRGVQKNLYDGQGPRVKEVWTQEAVRAASVSLIEPKSGEVVASACGEYEEDPGILKVVEDLTNALFSPK